MLMFNSPRELTAERMGVLARPPFVAVELRRSADLFQRIATEPFTMLILWLPGDGIDIEDILPAVRSARSPCSHSILIVLTRENRLEDCRPYLRMGVNALLADTASLEALDLVVAKQTQVAPRVETRVMVRFKATIQQAPQSVICQTVNLSSSGMFLAATTLPPIGTNLSFELPLPGQPIPIVGEAFVVRHASVGREKQSGLGAAFTSFRHDGWQVLRKFVDEKLGRPGRPKT